MKKILALIIFLQGLSNYAQINFESGYIIDNSGQITNCLIRNVDWMYNPIDFSFKFSTEGEVLKGNLDNVKEFGVNGGVSFIRAEVNLEISSSDIDKLSNKMSPELIKKKVFLKRLVKGKANLYSYQDPSITNYFFDSSNLEKELLVYKEYIVQTNRIAENNHYKQQLWNEFKYPDLTEAKLSKTPYKQEALIKIFRDYNVYFNEVEEVVSRKRLNTKLRLTLRPGIKNYSFEVRRINPFGYESQVKYPNETSFRIGLELEGVLPFNKNKWALLLEPSYQSYKTERVPSGSEVPEIVTYNSTEIALGGRHYMFINNNSSFFINASYVLALSNNSKIEYVNDGSVIDLNRSSNAAFGIGFKYDKKYSIEFSYNLERGLLPNVYSAAVISSYGLIFGYTLF